ncbi:MAG TPA: GtrA family protein [Hyphomicrobiales bacterium]|nr:GtrA family protein [Hyphomicrobiales bacterium]
MKTEFQRIIRFGIVGFVVANIYVGGYVTLTALGAVNVVANFTAFSLAVTVQYIGQTRWTFGRVLRNVRQLMRFSILIGIGLIYSTLVCVQLAPAMGWEPWLAAGVVAVTLPVINYTSSRLWIY